MVKVELARLLGGRREIKASTETFAQSEPLTGWWCCVMMRLWKLGRVGGGGSDPAAWGLRHLLGLPMGCHADRSMSWELRSQVWAEI